MTTFRDLARRQLGEHNDPAPLPCPDCGAGLAIDEDAEAFDPQTPDTRTPARIAGCTGCDFVIVF